MKISELEEETTDLDWFCVDRDGHLGHFATGGLRILPNVVRASAEDARFLKDFFRHGLAESWPTMLSNRLDAFVKFNDDLSRSRFVEDFLFMASHGLYSFDHERCEHWPAGYFLVAIPSVPLHIKDLPLEVRSRIRKTLPLSLAAVDRVGADVLT